MKKVGGKEPRHPREPVVRAAFARVLVELRKEAKMKQRKVAEESGYEEKYIGYLEHRKHTPTLTAVIEISRALKVSPVETLTRVLDLMPKFAYLENGAPTASTSDRDR